MMNKLANDIAIAVQYKLAAAGVPNRAIDFGAAAGGALKGMIPGSAIGAGLGGILGALRGPQQSLGQEIMSSLGLAKKPTRFGSALRGAAAGAGIGGLLGAGAGGYAGYNYGRDYLSAYGNKVREKMQSRGKKLLTDAGYFSKETPKTPVSTPMPSPADLIQSDPKHESVIAKAKEIISKFSDPASAAGLAGGEAERVKKVNMAQRYLDNQDKLRAQAEAKIKAQLEARAKAQAAAQAQAQKESKNYAKILKEDPELVELRKLQKSYMDAGFGKDFSPAFRLGITGGMGGYDMALEDARNYINRFWG